MINEAIGWINIFITGVVIAMLVAFRKGYKPKPDIVTNGLLQLLLPGLIITIWAIIEALFVLMDSAWITIWTVLNLLVCLIFFFIFNYSYFWYKGKYAPNPERLVIHNFKNCEPDGAPVNTFTSKFKQKADFVQLVDSNIDTLIDIAAHDFLGAIIHNYYQKHGKPVPNLNGLPEPKPEVKSKIPKKKVEEPPKTVESNKDLGKPLKKAEKDIEAIEQQVREAKDEAKKRVIEEKKAIFLTILDEVFKGWFFHVLYYKWDYLVPLTVEPLSGYTKSYILSPQSDLPIILDLNCALLFPENENEKKMTALFCLEGPRSEQALTKIDNISSELDSFVKPWVKTFEIEKIRRERDWWHAFAEGLLKGDDKILRTAITLKTRRSRYMPEEEALLILKNAQKGRDEKTPMVMP